MSLVQVHNVSLAFGERRILDAVSCNIDEGARIALSGDNGSGKSTFLKIIAGILQPDEGRILTAKHLRVSYLPQSTAIMQSTTVMEEVDRAYDWIRPLEREKTELEHSLADPTLRAEEAARRVERRHDLEEKLLQSGYYYRESQVSKVLTGLGFREKDFHTRLEQLSGGWKMRVSLAKVLLEHPDLLLLDEPTNYLDLEARGWLESFLSDYSGAVILVSHDRYFLDVTVNRIAEIFLGSLKIYHGNYSTYQKQRTAELAELTEAYHRQVKEIQKIEDFISRFRYNASKASLVQSRIRFLEKLERLEIPDNLKRIQVKFPPAPPSGNRVLLVENLNKCYGEIRVIKNLNLELTRGDRLALVGMNGAGKSTLMRILAGLDTDRTGNLILGTGVRMGYYSQDSADVLTGSSTVLEEAETLSTHMTDQELRNLLGAFLFRGEDIHKSLQVLSGGEKSRLALLKLLLSPVNLLLLDEPTNHLDMRSKEVLLNALKQYDGTLVFVAHDRSFIEELSGRVLDLEGDEPVYYFGGYDYYLYRKGQETSSQKDENSSKPEITAAGKQDRLAEKDRKRLIRKLRRREEEIMEQLAALEEEYTRLEGDLALPENYTDGERVKKLKEALTVNRKSQEALHGEWETVDGELADLGASEEEIPF
ncbi:MAG: ABC-F family ATP-binding cassette domain-containing protein [Spirochaetales bacterium]|nr:ABC-F family ATP-binding cassette domain-containing protein [Spirochaetales bacterium]